MIYYKSSLKESKLKNELIIAGKGYIHPSEPMQAVFFNTRAFEVITRVENVPARKPQNIFSYKSGDVFKDIKSGVLFTITKIARSQSGNKQYLTNSKIGNVQFSQEEIDHAINTNIWVTFK